jgi:hypothetical protein
MDGDGDFVGLEKWIKYRSMVADQQLKESLKELHDLKAALDEHASVAIAGPRGKIACVNDKFCSISKYSRAELLGQDHRLEGKKHECQ